MTNPDPDPWLYADVDGDKLAIAPDYRRCLCLTTRRAEDDEAVQILLNHEAAESLRDWLAAWLENPATQGENQ